MGRKLDHQRRRKGKRAQKGSGGKELWRSAAEIGKKLVKKEWRETGKDNHEEMCVPETKPPTGM